MRKKITLGLFLFTKLLFSQQDPVSQNPGDISNTASPNAAGFMRFQESPVNYYNGRSSFSIPIYEINVGGIKYPISLNYAHGGIQVNSMASDVGLGWSLTSTFINRTVVGDADLETVHDSRPNQQKSKYGYFDFINIWGGFDENYNPSEIIDYYPDLFKFVSPANNISFYFKNKSQVVELDKKKPLITWLIKDNNYQYLKNSSGEWINTFNIKDYEEFEITTKDGIRYTFHDVDLTHSFNDYFQYDSHSFGGISGTYPRVSSWNVSSIKDMNNGEQIDFIYEPYSSETSNTIGDIFGNVSNLVMHYF